MSTRAECPGRPGCRRRDRPRYVSRKGPRRCRPTGSRLERDHRGPNRGLVPAQAQSIPRQGPNEIRPSASCGRPLCGTSGHLARCGSSSLVEPVSRVLVHPLHHLVQEVREPYAGARRSWPRLWRARAELSNCPRGRALSTSSVTTLPSRCACGSRGAASLRRRVLSERDGCTYRFVLTVSWEPGSLASQGDSGEAASRPRGDPWICVCRRGVVEVGRGEMPCS